MDKQNTADRFQDRLSVVLGQVKWAVPSLLLIWMAAFVPRLVIALFFLDAPIALDDMYQYDMLARSLLGGNGYRWYAAEDVEVLRPYLSRILDLSQLHIPEDGLLTTHRPPGYPFFLAGLYWLAAEEFRFGLVRLVQAGLVSLLAPLATLVAEQLKFGRRAALLAGLGMAFYPIQLLYPLGLASENLFIPLFLASFLAIIRAAGGLEKGPVVLAGVLLGATMLTRSIVAPFVVLAALWLARFGRSGRRGGWILLLTAFGLCLPWAIRNTIVLNRPAFVETSLGYNLFIGYHPEGNGNFISRIAILPLNILDDGERERYTMQMALEFIRADPLEAARRVIPRAMNFLGPEDRELIYFYSNNYLGHIPQPWLTLIYLLLVIPWVSTVVLALLGMSIARERRFVWLALLLVGTYSLPHLLILAEPRFHLALAPALAPFAAYGWSERRRAIKLLAPANLLRSSRARLFYLCFLVLLALWIAGFVERWDLLMAVLGPEGNQQYLPY